MLMRTKPNVAVAVVAGLLLGSALSVHAPAAPPEDLSALLEPIRAEGDLPALGAVVISRGEIVAAGVVGVRARELDERATLDDLWHIGSCGKAFTATLLATLVEEQKLHWTTTIADVWPELKDKIREEYLRVTLEQLLRHRAGLPDDRRAGPMLMKIRMLQGELPAQRRRIVEMVLAQPPAAVPGAEMIYSNSGYVLAAAMAETVTGQSWEDLIVQRVAKPLGITTLGFGAPGSADVVDQPRGHGAPFGGKQGVPPGLPMSDNPAALRPAGGMHLSLADWARFAMAHLDAGKGSGAILKNETFERLQMLDEGPTEGYAMGWGVRVRPGLGAMLSHAGSNTMWFAMIALSRQNQCGVLVVSNSGNEKTQAACGKTSEQLLVRCGGNRPTASQPSSSAPSPAGR